MLRIVDRIAKHSPRSAGAKNGTVDFMRIGGGYHQKRAFHISRGKHAPMPRKHTGACLGSNRSHRAGTHDHNLSAATR
jgi:hypothetical protein